MAAGTKSHMDEISPTEQSFSLSPPSRNSLHKLPEKATPEDNKRTFKGSGLQRGIGGETWGGGENNENLGPSLRKVISKYDLTIELSFLDYSSSAFPNAYFKWSNWTTMLMLKVYSESEKKIKSFRCCCNCQIFYFQPALSLNETFNSAIFKRKEPKPAPWNIFPWIKFRPVWMGKNGIPFCVL